MFRLQLIALTFLAASPAFSATTLIRNVNVLDPETRTILPNRDVLIDGDSVKSVTAASETALSADRVIDGTGKYVTPGLIDMHVHVDLWRWGERADDWSLPLYVGYGVTTIRDAAGSPITLSLRKEVERGVRVGPRMFIATPFFQDASLGQDGNVIGVASADDAKSKIDAYLKLEYDFVKTNLMIADPVFDAMTAHLASKQSYLMGHPLLKKNADGFWTVDLGKTLSDYRTVEHLSWALGDYLQADDSPYRRATNYGMLLWYAFTKPDWNKLPDLISLLKANPALFTPTLHVAEVDSRFSANRDAVEAMGLDGFRKHPQFKYLPDYVYEDWMYLFTSWGTNPQRDATMVGSVNNQRRVIQAMDQAGIDLVAGTDFPARQTMVPGYSLHREMEELVKSGVSIWSALRAATSNAARALGKSNELGAIKDGAKADLILTAANPIDDLKALESPELIVSHGKSYDRTSLDALFVEAERVARSLDGRKLRLKPIDDHVAACDKPYVLGDSLDHPAHSHAKVGWMSRAVNQLKGWVATLF